MTQLPVLSQIDFFTDHKSEVSKEMGEAGFLRQKTLTGAPTPNQIQ